MDLVPSPPAVFRSAPESPFCRRGSALPSGAQIRGRPDTDADPVVAPGAVAESGEAPAALLGAVEPPTRSLSGLHSDFGAGK